MVLLLWLPLITEAQQQTTIKNGKGEVVYIRVETASGYIVKDKSGKIVYRVVENDREKRVYDANGHLISKEIKR